MITSERAGTPGEGSPSSLDSEPVLRIPWVRRPIDVAHAIIVGALIVALGSVFTAVGRDWKNSRDQVRVVDQSRACRHWEESARLVAFERAERFVRAGGTLTDPRSTADYWVAADKVQRWYPKSLDSPVRMPRPEHC